ncbi:hypothetical protein JRO89_XS08G0228600 [Xanthoceras sorbifolium]|uniref:Uncharacterized protein n=1 Tax=Xanthoceras sorbifolium TaxID=99658 RepID=A0ABQ8HR22_9ROSI|nr:hypothetical protein JRO89_XS08G0228600 [Xanthoceras sorbifolium]
MAATTTETVIATTTKPARTKLVCFSFAAYAKTLLDHLKSLNIPILPGLNDDEFADIESTFNFTFPPDLRSILQEGLPVGPSFPNWRSSSQQQLRILLSLPSLSMSKNISLNNFWSDSWGPKPKNMNDALSLVKQLLDKAPVLVPIYRNCYIPSTLVFQRSRVLASGWWGFQAIIDRKSRIDMPAWAAKEARRIQFWTEVTERGRAVARGETHGWWSGSGGWLGLKCCLEEVILRLRDGGWREEEIREMMMMMDGCDDKIKEKAGVQFVGDHKKGVILDVRFLSVLLLNAGWSREDVVYSLNLQKHEKVNEGDPLGENSTYLEFEHPSSRFSKKKDDDDDVHDFRSLRCHTNLIL